LITVRDLPAINALLNSTAAVLLVWGWFLIRARRVQTHRRVMITAFGVSVAFLISYLFYHFEVGSVRFQKTGPIRVVYFTILLTHTLLATAVPFLAVATLWRGWTASYEKHRRIARWTLPIWLYVSVTGVAVYWMLYRL
jgi:putative membrane protein